jgi:hypothetical protein
MSSSIWVSGAVAILCPWRRVQFRRRSHIAPDLFSCCHNLLLNRLPTLASTPLAWETRKDLIQKTGGFKSTKRLK